MKSDAGTTQTNNTNKKQMHLQWKCLVTDRKTKYSSLKNENSVTFMYYNNVEKKNHTF